jgi:hypothetical protein
MPVHKKIKKFVKKAIPKEIAPFVPAVAGMFLGPAVSGILGNLGAGLAAKSGIGSLVGKALTNKMVAGGLGRALVDVGAQALTSDRISPASALLSGGLGALSGYQPNVVGPEGPLKLTGLQKAGLKLRDLGRVGNLGEDFDLLSAAKMANVGGTLKAADDELAAQKERAKNLAMESEAFRIGDNAERRQSIISSMLAAGFDRREAEAAAAEEGYAMGGRVGFDMGGMPERGGGANEEAMAEMMMNMESDEFYIDGEGNLRRIPRRRPRMNTRPGMNEDAIADQMFMMQMNERMGRKDGGKVPGLPAGRQVDAREGMFIPMGGAKRADDVPAMLSVNEFVLNDDAVAGLGKLMTGNPDPRAGARALYKIQDQLEAMV